VITISRQAELSRKTSNKQLYCVNIARDIHSWTMHWASVVTCCKTCLRELQTEPSLPRHKIHKVEVGSRLRCSFFQGIHLCCLAYMFASEVLSSLGVFSDKIAGDIASTYAHCPVYS